MKAFLNKLFMIDDIRGFKYEPEHERKIFSDSMPWIFSGGVLIIGSGLYALSVGKTFFDVWMPITTPLIIASHIIGFGMLWHGLVKMKVAVDRANAINEALAGVELTATS